MKILIIEPFFTGSHSAWANGIKKFSAHDIYIIKLPGKHWKWRMHGSAITLAKKFKNLNIKPDLIIATDMIDLTSFLALTRKETHSTPVILYFHENQLNYPWSPKDRDLINKRDKHYVFINYISAIAADHIFFNSKFHMDSFTNELPKFLELFPDYREKSSVDLIKKKSEVLHLGIDLKKFDGFIIDKQRINTDTIVPTILWNHRWEYDKNPGDFFEALYSLDRMGLKFKVVIIGRNSDVILDHFTAAEKRLGDKIVKFGYAETFDEYAKWLWKSDILPVTSNHDFFGISIIEALYCNTIPLLPKRLAYPEIIPIKDFKNFYYDNQKQLVSLLKKRITDFNNIDKSKLKKNALIYDWENMIKKYDDKFEKTIGGKK
ncbi:DUF3524 domain-containing protein [Spirochaetota bacterium]